MKFAGDANAASRCPIRAAAARMSAAERTQTLPSSRSGSAPRLPPPGPVANFILAIVLFTGLILHNGHTVLAPVIGDVVKGSAAEAAGIKAGDRVTAIDGTAITDFEQMPQIISVSGGRNLKIDLVRGRASRSAFMSCRSATRMRDVLGDMGTNVVIGVRPSPTAPITTEYYSLPARFRRRLHRDLGHHAHHGPGHRSRWSGAMPAPTSSGGLWGSPK